MFGSGLALLPQLLGTVYEVRWFPTFQTLNQFGVAVFIIFLPTIVHAVDATSGTFKPIYYFFSVMLLLVSLALWCISIPVGGFAVVRGYASIKNSAKRGSVNEIDTHMSADRSWYDQQSWGKLGSTASPSAGDL